jgi:hypothetical protein
MTPVETALIVLVIIWSIIFIVFGAAMILIMWGVRKALDKVNNILDDAEKISSGVSLPIRAAASAILGLMEKGKKKLPKS